MTKEKRIETKNAVKLDDQVVNVGLKRIQIITFVSLVIDLLGFTVILPLFPALLDYYSKNDSSGIYFMLQRTVSTVQLFFNVPEEYNSILFGGVLGSIFSFLQFLSSPICGALSDVYGRKPIMICCLIGISLSYSLWAVSSNFAIFILSRVIGGLCKGNVSLSYSVMTDILDTSSRSKGMALIGIAFSIGFIIGPVVGVGFSKWGSTGWFAATALYALFLAIINIIFVILLFPETLPILIQILTNQNGGSPGKQSSSRQVKNGRSFYKGSKRKKSLGSEVKETSNFISPSRLFAFKAVGSLEKKEQQNLIQLGHIYFLYMFIYSGLEFTITFVTHYHHKFDSMAQGKMFTYLGIIMAIVQGGFARRIKAGQEKRTAILGLAVMTPSFMIFGICSTIGSLYLGLTLYAIGSSLIVTCLTALASKHGPTSEKGTILGIWRSLGALARASGPIVACLGFWSLGCAWAYTIGGLCLLIPLFMLTKIEI